MTNYGGPHSRRQRAAALRDLIRKANEELDRIGRVDLTEARLPPGHRRPDPRKVRAWALARGVVVGRTGRIRADLLEDYCEAHPEEVDL